MTQESEGLVKLLRGLVGRELLVAAVKLGYVPARATLRERNRLCRAVMQAAHSISGTLGYVPNGEAVHHEKVKDRG